LSTALSLCHLHTFSLTLSTSPPSLSSAAGIKWIEEEELKLSDYVYSRLSADPRIYLLGKNGGWKGHHLPIFAFMIRRGRRFLHYNLVALLLNDLFGIQCRGEVAGYQQSFHWFTSLSVCPPVFSSLSRPSLTELHLISILSIIKVGAVVLDRSCSISWASPKRRRAFCRASSTKTTR
jgi:hypothetical protein